MTTLTSCEILEELNKLGIKAPSELIQFLNEYAEYYCHTQVSID